MLRSAQNRLRIQRRFLVTILIDSARIKKGRKSLKLKEGDSF